jgi:hypothetical protein
VAEHASDATRRTDLIFAPFPFIVLSTISRSSASVTKPSPSRSYSSNANSSRASFSVSVFAAPTALRGVRSRTRAWTFASVARNSSSVCRVQSEYRRVVRTLCGRRTTAKMVS